MSRLRQMGREASRFALGGPEASPRSRGRPPGPGGPVEVLQGADPRHGNHQGRPGAVYVCSVGRTSHRRTEIAPTMVRLSPSEREDLREMAAANGLTLSAAIRDSVAIRVRQWRGER